MLTRSRDIQATNHTLCLCKGLHLKPVLCFSDEEARQKIYSVSTRHYFAFGALVSEEFYWKLKELPMVLHVAPDLYLDVKNKEYGGEPFINGEAAPYDPKYHEEYLRLTHSLIARPDHGGGNPGYPGGDQGCQGQGGDSTKSITV